VRYRNAQGQGWDGGGAMPDWLLRAIHAGGMGDISGRADRVM
jgi:DNA-binding protein H-NS